MPLLSIDPSTNKVIEQYEPHSEAEIDRRIGTAVAAARRMREMPIAERARIVGKAIGEKLVGNGVKAVVFDRNGFIYHGRVKEIADGAREAGLAF